MIGVMWRTPGELVSVGFQLSQVVMMNEGRNGLSRCVRTRRVGHRVLATADEAGCRTLAMEALPNRGNGPSRYATRPEGNGYLAQPEMIELIDAAVSLGWTLIGYEADSALATFDLRADTQTMEFTNWRERAQADNLAKLVDDLNGRSVLVWVGNGHHAKVKVLDWTPMGYLLNRVHGLEFFSIDQLATVALAPGSPPQHPLTKELADRLDAMGGTAGFTGDDPPPGFHVAPTYDAWIVSTDNEMVGDPSDG